MSLSGQAVTVLKSHPWPGNVRELKNVMERVALFGTSSEVSEREIRELIDPGTLSNKTVVTFDGTHQEFMENAEKQFIEHKLNELDWNVTQTARELGMQRSNLYKKIERYELNRPE